MILQHFQQNRSLVWFHYHAHPIGMNNVSTWLKVAHWIMRTEIDD